MYVATMTLSRHKVVGVPCGPNWTERSSSVPNKDRKSGGDGASIKSETNTRLLSAVVQVVFEQGYAGATMTRIAKQAGVTRGAIQHYFGDRRVDLMTAVCADLLERRQSRYRESMSALLRSDSKDVREQLKRAYKDPETWFLIEVWIASKSDEALRRSVESYLQGTHDADDRDLAVLFSAQVSGQVDFHTYKYFLRTITRGLALEYSRRPDEALFDKVADFAFDALAALLQKQQETAS
jgi:AcrR family transcriptional regulator